jgi:hypothetical protein
MELYSKKTRLMLIGASVVLVGHFALRVKKLTSNLETEAVDVSKLGLQLENLKVEISNLKRIHSNKPQEPLTKFISMTDSLFPTTINVIKAGSSGEGNQYSVSFTASYKEALMTINSIERSNTFISIQSFEMKRHDDDKIITTLTFRSN